MHPPTLRDGDLVPCGSVSLLELDRELTYCEADTDLLLRAAGKRVG